MIAAWMASAVLVGVSLVVAATMTERALRAWRRPARGVWGAALLLLVALPVSAALLPRRAPTPLNRRTSAARGESGATTRLAAFVVRAGAAARRTPALERIDRSLGIGWALASATLAVSLVGSARRLRRARRRWPVRDVAGTRVLLSDDVGPAVVGLRRAAIVLPEWTLSLDAPLLALVVRHEREHVRAGDPLLLALGAATVVAMPWNPAAWWALRRLRLAAELDCDARVLAAHTDASRYGLLLLAVAQRRATAPWQLSGAPALVESSSDLSRRIIAMRTARPRHRLLTSTIAAALAASGVAGAVAACAASRDVVGPAGKQVPNGAQALQLPARTVHPADSTQSGIVAERAPGTSLIGDVATVVDAASRPVTAAPAPRATPATGPRELPPGGAYFEFQVERPVAPAPGSPGPRYPDALREAKVEGVVMAQFVVDTTGRVMPGSFRVLKAPADTAFVSAVRMALPNMQFEPALVGGRKVRQLVQQPFQFSLTR